MFNMQTVGRKIAELRKKQNLTQLDLADKMGTSFQAVSNWERGNSMPDIAKLPELAKLFDVTIDALLGQHSEIVENVVNGDMKDYFKDHNISTEELIEVAPILKPNQVDEILDSIRDIDLDSIEELLPFMSKEAINNIAVNAAKTGNYDNLDTLAPFMSKDALYHVADMLQSKFGFSAIEDLLPFLSRDKVDTLVLKAIKEDDYDELGIAAPFMNKNTIDSISQAYFTGNYNKKPNSITLDDLSPKDRETVETLVENAKKLVEQSAHFRFKK